MGFVDDWASEGAMVYTNNHGSYHGLPRPHETASSTRSVSTCATKPIRLKRGYHGTYHHMSEKHLDRYVTEFEGRLLMTKKCCC